MHDPSIFWRTVAISGIATVESQCISKMLGLSCGAGAVARKKYAKWRFAPL